MQPIWLTWARELQAIAQTGLAFSRDPFDQERYRSIRSLAARIMAEHSEIEPSSIEALFSQQAGYGTPKVDVRGAVFSGDGHILLVREVADAGRWTLPGGWADVNEPPSESVMREVREESGFEVGIRKMAAVFDRDRHGHLRRMRSMSTSSSLSAILSGERRGQDRRRARSGSLPRMTCRATCPSGACNGIRLSGCSSIGERRPCRQNLISSEID
jgi:ADP-ribose pyrophosphatase YjhB (NUDIX family)